MTPTEKRALKRRIMTAIGMAGSLTTGELVRRLNADSNDVCNALTSLERAGQIDLVGVVNRQPCNRAGGQRLWKAIGERGGL